MILFINYLVVFLKISILNFNSLMRKECYRVDKDLGGILSIGKFSRGLGGNNRSELY